MSRRERILALVVAGLVGLFALDRVVIQPVSAHLRALAAEADELEDRLRSARVLIENRELIDARWERYVAAGLGAEPSSQRLRVQRKLNEWAAEAGVDLAALSSGRTGLSVGDRFHEMRLIVRGSGTLEAIVNFLHRIRRSPFPLRIVAGDLGARSGENEALSLQLTVSTIRLTEDAAGDREASGGQGGER